VTAARTWVGVGLSEYCTDEMNRASARADASSEVAMVTSPTQRYVLANTAALITTFMNAVTVAARSLRD
jgi:hypothetical protein